MKKLSEELRIEHAWPYAELAERLGVSRQTVITIELDKYDPALPFAFRIARVFGQLINAIFDLGERAPDSVGTASHSPIRKPVASPAGC